MRMPDRKVLAGGIAGVVTWALMLIATKYGYGGYFSEDMQPLIVSCVGSLIAYFVPASQYDKYKRMDDALVVMAQNDPTVAVTKPPGVPTAAPGIPLGKAATAALNAEKRAL